MFKSICVAGMPRAGSMWTFNVVRELARAAGHRVLPEEVKLVEKEWFEYADRELATNPDPNIVFVLKTHLFLRAFPPNCLVITNIRDVRDALMSYMRFMHVGFEQAFEGAKGAAAISDHYAGFPEDQRMVLRYEQITQSPGETVEAIAARMGVTVDQATVSEIVSTFSKDRVRSMIEDRDQRYRAAVAAGQKPAGEVTLGRPDGDYATIDMATGFQSKHVSDYQDGDWRDLLSEDQISVMQQTLGGWLTRHGYDL